MVGFNLGLRSTTEASRRRISMAESTNPTMSQQEREVVARVPTKLWINGAWRDGSAGTLEVHDPATGEVIARVADATPDDGLAALSAAGGAQPAWAATPPRD